MADAQMHDGATDPECNPPSLAGLAERETRAAQSDRVETQHIVLAMLGPDRSIAGDLLDSLGVTRTKAEAAIRRVIDAGVQEERHRVTANRTDIAKRTGTLLPSRQAEEAFLSAGAEAPQRTVHYMLDNLP